MGKGSEEAQPVLWVEYENGDGPVTGGFEMALKEGADPQPGLATSERGEKTNSFVQSGGD